MPIYFAALRNLSDFASANLTWNASTDNLTASANLTYQICQSTISGSCAGTFIPTYTSSAGATSLSLTGISANVKYYYVMRAIDALGNISAISNETPLVDYLGIFAATGSMASARQYHTATPLPNGKALITGGHNGAAVVATAQIYDPALGTFAATGSMTSARYYHTATLLANGKVLITGGHNGAAVVATAEIYDPALGTFAATGSMTSARYLHTATLLANGKVLITGGHNGAAIVATAEIYDPALGTFAATGPMAWPRYYHAATLLANGKVLVSGGMGGGATAEIYNPVLGTFAATGSMTSARQSHTATLLANNKVLITAGNVNGTPSGILATSEIYDPALGTFVVSGSMYGGRWYQTATLLANGKVLITGGENVNSTVTAWIFLATSEIYDPALGTFGAISSMASARYLHTATLLANGKVLIAGGNNGAAVVATAEIYQ